MKIEDIGNDLRKIGFRFGIQYKNVRSTNVNNPRRTFGWKWVISAWKAGEKSIYKEGNTLNKALEKFQQAVESGAKSRKINP